MSTIRAVHECLFCPQVFDSAAAKDDHVLEHFAQEICTDCNQNLIRIGGHLYVRHSAATCIKSEFKSEATIAFIDETPVKEEPIPEYETEFDNSDIFQFDTEIFEYSDEDIAHNEDALEVKTEPTELHEEQDIFISHIESTFQIATQSNSNDANHKKSAVDNRSECDIYGKYFHPNSLKRHKRDVHGESGTNIGGLKCASCNIVFKSRASRCNHMWRKHNPDGKFRCKLCSQAFPTESSLKDHHCYKVDLSKKSGVCCGTCGKVHGDKHSHCTHMRMKHDPSLEKFKCQLCQSVFLKESSLQTHRCKRLLGFKCKLCRREYTTKSSLREHKCRCLPKEVPVPCDICGKTFISKGFLEKHQILLHSPPGTIFCSVCAQIFTNVDDRDAHKSECDAKNSIACDICGKVLRKTSLRSHTILLHSSPDVIFCNFCARKFTTTEERDTHRPECALKQRIRKSKRANFWCDICGKKCRSKTVLTKHTILAHSPEGMIFCSVCARMFSNVEDRDVHEPECKLELKIRTQQTSKRKRSRAVPILWNSLL